MDGHIRHNAEGNDGSFEYEVNGTKMAGMYYIMAGETKMIIEHTEVDESLKGHGIGKRLLGSLVDFVREHGIKVVPLCPFAKATFQKTMEWQDVLA